MSRTLLELHLESGACNQRQRHPMCPPPLGHEHDPVFNPGQSAGKMRLGPYRFTGHNLGQATHEPPIIRLAPERSIQTWRGHLQRKVGVETGSECLLDIEQRPEVSTHTLAILDPDRFLSDSIATVRRRGAINNHAEHPPDRFATDLDVEQLQPVAGSDAARGRSQAAGYVVSNRSHRRSTGG